MGEKSLPFGFPTRQSADDRGKLRGMTLRDGMREMRNRFLLRYLLPVLAFPLSFMLFWLQQHEWMPLVNLEKQLLQERFEMRGPQGKREDLVILAIDDVSKELNPEMFSDDEKGVRPLELMASFPFPREVYAHIADRLIAAGAKVVAYDLLYPSASLYGPEDDAQFARALREHRDRVVIGANIQNPKNPGVTDEGFVNGISLPVSSLIDDDYTGIVGFVNYFPHTDGTIREALHEVSLEILAAPHRFAKLDDWHERILSWDALIVKKADPKIPWRSYEEPGMINFQGPAGTYRAYSLYEIFSPRLWEANFGDGAFFQDKIVLIGPTGNWTQDYHDTPYGVMAGVEIHAHSIATILNGSYLRGIYDWWARALIILLPTLAVACVMQFARGNLRGVAGFLLVLALFLAGGQIAFQKFLIVAPMAWGLVGILLMEIVGLAYRITLEALERKRIRSTFDRYVSKNVAAFILKNRKEYEQSLGGVRKPVTVLFSDIRGFTTMTESADAGALVEQLNEYFGEMVPCVFRHGGTLHKFIGDAVMAVWGDTHSRGVKPDALAAVRSVCEMTELLKKLNGQWKAIGKEELKIGVGLNHGEVIVGNIGAQERMEFTVIGDAVNLASRLEGATKEFRTDKLIGESVAQFVREEFWLQSAGLITVKGKTKPVGVFIPHCERGKEPPGFDSAWLEDYERGYAAYQAKQFAQAKEIFAIVSGGNRIHTSQQNIWRLVRN
ncbi:adenylate/guanylate cyclase domain-containing protein [Oscillatoria amoena NRMC-F 0135]|nr:adenylate/guanylate cyclase domain-containing protein [Oscillatoria amoena NRMC-F 0135]